jgi:hypothetical protein
MGARLLLLLSAYSPLVLIIGIRDHNTRQSWGLIGVGLLLALGLPVVIAAAGLLGHPQLARVGSAADAAEEITGYLASFILPFATLSAPSGRDLVAFAVFGVFLAAAYLHSGKLALNPWLFFVRHRVYDVDVGNGPELVLARRAPSAGDELTLTRLAHGLYYARGATS